MTTMRRLIGRLDEVAKLDFSPSEEPISANGARFSFYAWPDHFLVMDNGGMGHMAQVAAEKNPAAGRKLYRLMQDAKIREELTALETAKAVWAWLDVHKIAHH